MTFTIDNPPGSLLRAEDEAMFAAARSTATPALDAQSMPVAGTPKGILRRQHHVGTTVYPGVERDYFVYTPATKAAAPLSLMVFQDAWLYLRDDFGLTAALDNLIAAGDIPPMVVVFVDPGDLPGAPPQSRGNRSLEYDTTNDLYVQFLLDELLPAALQGLDVSANPADRAICGMSSGGICAFNAAWHRPEQFAKVLSHCGSFTNIRDGHLYPSWVRKFARKPLRVFLQTGAADLDDTRGSWPAANFDLAAALKLKSYDYRLEFGLGAHDLKHAAAIFPATLRWLWR